MKDLSNFGKIVALLSFLIGSILLILYIYFKSQQLITIGIYYIIIAFWINIILLVVLIIASIINSFHRKNLLKTCGIVLLNIPIAILYFYLLIQITF